MLISWASAAIEPELDKVKVIGNTSKANMPLSQQFFSREDFIGKYQNISELLQIAPGVQVRRSSNGNPPKISILGSTHKQVTFIIDGQIINSAQSGDFNIDLIPVQQIESIEIIQSGNSSYTQAIGGAISITTISTVNKNNLTLTSGNFDHREAGITLSGNRYGNSLLSLNALSNNGSYEYPVPSPFDQPEDENRTESINNNAYYKYSSLLKWNKGLSKNLFIDSKIQYIRTKKETPDFQMNNPNNDAFLSERKWFYGIGLKWKVNDRITSNSQFTKSTTDEKYEDLNSVISFRATSNLYTIENHSLSEKLSLLTDSGSYAISINTDIESYSENQTLVSDDNKCNSDVAICDTVATQKETSLTATYRFTGPKFETIFNIGNTWLSREQDKTTGASSKTKIKQKYDSWSMSYQNYSWSIGSLRLDTNKGYRLPSLYELFGDRGLLKSNSNIQPETSRNSAIEFNFNEIELLSIHINTSVGIFHKDISDVIVPIYSGSIGTFSNTSSANITGLQSSLSFRKENLSLSLSSTLQDSSTKSEIKSFNNKKLAGIYHEKFIYSVNYKLNNTSFIILDHQVENGLYIDMANKNSKISNGTTNFKFNQSFEKSTINISINNLFNNEYYDQNNRPIIDRSASLNFQHQF
jgi:outer membrane cobalamin receptor